MTCTVAGVDGMFGKVAEAYAVRIHVVIEFTVDAILMLVGDACVRHWDISCNGLIL